MASLNLTLTDHLDQFLRDQVAAGRYQDAEEVVRAGLRPLEQQEREDAAILQAMAAEGFSAIDRGEGVVLGGEQELADFIAHIGRRAARSIAHGAGTP